MAFLTGLLAIFGFGCCVGMTLDAIDNPRRRTRYIIIREKRNKSKPQIIELTETNKIQENEIIKEAVLVEEK